MRSKKLLFLTSLFVAPIYLSVFSINGATYKDYLYVEFYTSMGKYNPYYARLYQKYVTNAITSHDNGASRFSCDRGTYPLAPSDYLAKLANAYEAYNPYTLSQQPRFMQRKSIPHVIHQIWLGSPFPEKYKAWANSWKEKHPDWTYILWTDESIKSLTMINKDIFDAAQNWGEKSDILRFEILYQFGGLYVDTDFECIKPFDCIHDLYDFYIGMAPLDSGPIYTGIGLLAATPKHPICEDYIKNLKKYQNLAEVYMRTGPIPFSRSVGEKFGIMFDMVFPATYFYPLGLEEKANAHKIAQLITRYPEHFAIHHWHGSWK